MKRVVIALAVLLWAAPALAVDHWQVCKSSHEAGTARLTESELTLSSRLSPASGTAKSLCYDTDGTVDSLLLNTESCTEVDVLVYDFTGNHDATLNWMACPSNNVDATACEAVNGSTPLTGDSTTPAFEIQGHGQNYGYVDILTNVNTRTVRVEVRCNGH